MTPRRAHKTNYRDGVSDYIRLFVCSLWWRLVYWLDLQPSACVCVCVSLNEDNSVFLALHTTSEQRDYRQDAELNAAVQKHAGTVTRQINYEVFRALKKVKTNVLWLHELLVLAVWLCNGTFLPFHMLS